MLLFLGDGGQYSQSLPTNVSDEPAGHIFSAVWTYPQYISLLFVYITASSRGNIIIPFCTVLRLWKQFQYTAPVIML